jgi:tRNA pseudouridine55 synthase
VQTPTPAPRQHAGKTARESIHGVLLLDKPLGLSSNDAMMRARRLLNAEKAGHGGTLDPLASGLLPLAFGEATKFADDLLSANKTYIAGMRLGMTTTTGDREGDITTQQSVAPGQFSNANIETVLAQFRGPQHQVPPMYSALKKDGKPLYDYARRGETVDRPARAIYIHQLSLEDGQDVEAFPDSYPVMADHPVVHLQVSCSKGTYIRVLVEDIGRALGCGAHLASLRRTQVDHLSMQQGTSLSALEALSLSERRAMLYPVDALLQKLPRLTLSLEHTQRLLMGQKLPPQGYLDQLDAEQQEKLRLMPDKAVVAKAYGAQNQLLGTVEIDYQALRPKRLVRG